MPALGRINQHEKRNRLPSDQILRSTKDRIVTWWHSTYQSGADRLLAERFALETTASLPSVMSSTPSLEDVCGRQPAANAVKA
jgi:hypothetical protein